MVGGNVRHTAFGTQRRPLPVPAWRGRAGAGASEAAARHRQRACAVIDKGQLGRAERGRSGGRADGPEIAGPVGAPT